MSNSSPLFANRMIARIMFGCLFFVVLLVQSGQQADSAIAAFQEPTSKNNNSAPTHSEQPQLAMQLNDVEPSDTTLYLKPNVSADASFSNEPKVVGVAMISAEYQVNTLAPLVAAGLLALTFIAWRRQSIT